MSHDNLINRVATEESFDPDLVHAMVRTESGGRSGAVSNKGARGLMQLMPQTAIAMGVQDPNDPEQNLRGGIRYMSQLQGQYPGRTDLALAAYNMGPTALRRHISQYGDDMSAWPQDQYRETLSYVPKISGLYERRTGRPFMVADAGNEAVSQLGASVSDTPEGVAADPEVDPESGAVMDRLSGVQHPDVGNRFGTRPNDDGTGWHHRAGARGFAAMDEIVAELSDVAADHSGGLVEPFARQLTEHLRRRVAELEEIGRPTGDETLAQRLASVPIEMAASLPPFLAAVATGGLIPGLAGIGYLHGRSTGDELESAGKYGVLGLILRAGEFFPRNWRVPINFLATAGIFAPPEGYEDWEQFFGPALIAALTGIPAQAGLSTRPPSARFSRRGKPEEAAESEPVALLGRKEVEVNKPPKGEEAPIAGEVIEVAAPRSVIPAKPSADMPDVTPDIRAARRIRPDGSERDPDIQEIMDRYNVSEENALGWVEQDLRDRILPRLMEADLRVEEKNLAREAKAQKKRFAQEDRRTSKVLDEIRDGLEPELRGMKKYPILSDIKGMGGVDPNSKLGSELISMGITVSGKGSIPGLFRKPGGTNKWGAPTGRGDLDQFDFTDNEYLVGRDQDPQGRYQDYEVLDAIDREWRGDPLRTEAEYEKIGERQYPREQLSEELDLLGIDIGSMSNDEILAELRGNRGTAAVEEVAPGAAPSAAEVWHRGESQENASGDLFFSGSDDVAGDYGTTRQIRGDELPGNPLEVGSKEELAGRIGYEGDPLAEPLSTPVQERFDSMAKEHAKNLGHDGIRYENGSMGEPELHVFPTPRAAAEPSKGIDLKTNPDPIIAVDFAGIGTMEAALGPHATKHAAEVDPTVSAEYNKSHGSSFEPQNVQDVTPDQIRGSDLYEASPVCKSCSTAKRGRKVTPEDISSAEKIGSLIAEGKPSSVAVENVPEFAIRKELIDPITDALEEGGYAWDVQVHDAADYGAAMTRNRLVIRGVRDGELPGIPEKQAPGDWWEVIKDLVDEAPDAPFGAPKKKRLAEGKTDTWEEERISDMVERGDIDLSKPIITMGGSASKDVAYARNSGGPAPTLVASEKSKPRVILPDGRIKELTPRMMARLMGLPDAFPVPENRGLAKKVLGNGIHADTTRAFIEPLAREAAERRLAGNEDSGAGATGEQPGSQEPPPSSPTSADALQKTPLEERPVWELTRSEEATLQGVSPELISALERAPAPGPRIGPKGGVYPRRPLGGDMARGVPRASREEIDQLKKAGFLDDAGELTVRGKQIIEGRHKRFVMFRDAARRGERIDRGAARDWPLQIARAYRYQQTMKNRGQKPKAPGHEPSDRLSANEAKNVTNDILDETRWWDEKRGRKLMEEINDEIGEIVEARISRSMQEKLVAISKDFFGSGEVPLSPSRIFVQMANHMRSGRLTSASIKEILDRHGLTLEQLAEMVATDLSISARDLASRSVLKRLAQRGKLNRTEKADIIKRLEDEPDMAADERAHLERLLDTGILTEEEVELLSSLGISQEVIQGMGLWRRLENLRRGMLVSQISTAMRNGFTQQANITVHAMQSGMEQAIKHLIGGTGTALGSKRLTDYADSIHPVHGFETFVRVFHEGGHRLVSWRAEGAPDTTKLLSYFDKERDALVSQFNSDITAVKASGRILKPLEKLALLLNGFNRFQEHIFRRAVFHAELSRQVEMYPVGGYKKLSAVIENDLGGDIPVEMIRRSVEKGLELTWAKNFNKHGNTYNKAASSVIKIINDVPLLSYPMPFPRFIANAIQWQVEHSPGGLLRYLAPKSREELLDGDVSGISKAMLGTGMFFLALKMREKDEETGEYKYGATDNYFLFKSPDSAEELVGLREDSMIDIRPYSPFLQYAFFAYVFEKVIQPMIDNMMDGGNRPSEINNLSLGKDGAQAILGSSARSGVGVYVLDQMIDDLIAVHEGEGSSGAILGTVVGNVAQSYFTYLQQFYNGMKSFDQFNDDLESSKVRESRVHVDEYGVPIEGFLDNFRASFAAEFGTRGPWASSMDDEGKPMYPEVQLATQREAPISYAPMIKTLTGITFKEPYNLYQKEAARFDFGKTDILPSSGVPAWDDAIALHMGPRIEDDLIPQLEGDYYKGLSKVAQVQYLRERTAAVRAAATLDAKHSHPDLWDYVKKVRQDVRKRRLIDEKLIGAETPDIGPVWQGMDMR